MIIRYRVRFHARELRTEDFHSVICNILRTSDIQLTLSFGGQDGQDGQDGVLGITRMEAGGCRVLTLKRKSV